MSLTPATPSRALAAFLALALPSGVGHAFVGQTRRGVVWLVVCFASWVAAVVLAPSLGTHGALWLLAATLALRLLGPALDILTLPRERLRATNLTGVLVFAALGLVGVVVMSLGTRRFLLESFKIPSGAMIPTLLVGDHLFVDKAVYRTRSPRRGEVMVFAFPEHPDQDFIKRVIALPGDQLDVKNGHPWLNGWEVPHCVVGTYSYVEPDYGRHEGELDVEFLGEQSYLTFYDASAGGPDQQGPFHATKGEYWVMGDNRDNSHDSRMWFHGAGGGVPDQLIRGHALFMWTSVRADGSTDASRVGLKVEGATLPSGSEALQPALDACLRARPELARTTPPPPKGP